MSDTSTTMDAHVLMPAFTVADWGGLHENVVYAVQACLRAGLRVTAAARPGQFAHALRASGADVIEVEWEQWEDFLPQVLSEGPYDLIFTQPFTSRRLALAVSRITGTPVVAMFHGFNHDYVYMWQDKVSSLAVTADVLKKFLIDFCRVSPEKITVIPNGIPIERFEAVSPSRAQKLASGALHVLLASRLTPDKRSQMDVLKSLIGPLAEFHADQKIVIDVLGGGPEELRIRTHLSAMESTYSNVEGRMHGWVDATIIPEFLDQAYVSITAGRAALQSMVAGTPTIAAGARGIAGPVWGYNREAAIASNFGDYPIQGQHPWSPKQAVRDLLDEETYVEIQKQSRDALFEREQSQVDHLLMEFLKLSIDPTKLERVVKTAVPL